MNSYYEKQSQTKNKESKDGTTTSNSESSVPRSAYPESRLVNRSFLSQLHQSPACFADTNFWIESGYNRRARWFDHRLSFAGGHIIAAYWSETDKKINPDFSFQSWYRRMIDQVDSVVDKVVALGPRPMTDIFVDEQSRVDLDQPSAKLGTGTTTMANHILPNDIFCSFDELKSSVERFVAQGRITGRTPSDIRVSSSIHFLNCLATFSIRLHFR